MEVQLLEVTFVALWLGHEPLGARQLQHVGLTHLQLLWQHHLLLLLGVVVEARHAASLDFVQLALQVLHQVALMEVLHQVALHPLAGWMMKKFLKCCQD